MQAKTLPGPQILISHCHRSAGIQPTSVRHPATANRINGSAIVGAIRWPGPHPRTEGKAMPPANGQIQKTEYGTVIYLRGTQEDQLDDAERRCREYAARFGWPVLASIRDNEPSATPGQFLAKVSRLGAQILLTENPAMISPDQATRDELTMAVEGTGCIVHPLRTQSCQ
jgi:hypothetical protein